MGEYYAIVRKGESISHHGIHGQKWGIRRFQNPDGTLTEAGKKRYRTTSSNPEDINDLAGIALRKKDVEKSIRLNEKARGKEHSKIANNPENFLGLNKRHANKIDKYTKNIDAGKAEVENILAKIAEKKEGLILDRPVDPNDKKAVSKNARNVMKANRNNIEKQVIDELSSDISRWNGISNEQAKAVISKEVKKHLDLDSSEPFVFKDGTISMIVGSFGSWNDGQPVTIDYDPKKRKITYLGPA